MVRILPAYLTPDGVGNFLSAFLFRFGDYLCVFLFVAVYVLGVSTTGVRFFSSGGGGVTRFFSSGGYWVVRFFRSGISLYLGG